MTTPEVLAGAAWLWAAAFAYALPVLVAAVRDVDRLRRVALLSLIGGWTGVAWVVALWLAVRTPRQAAATRAFPRDDAAWAALGVATARVPAPHPSWSGWS